MLVTEQLKKMADMTATDKSIANYFLNYPHELEEISARKLASTLYLSPSTIVRFCQKMGFTGYESFRQNYLEEYRYLNAHFNEIDTNRPFEQVDSDWQIASKLGHLYHETIDDTLNLIRYEVLEQARKILTNNEMIYIYSSGDLIIPAYNFKNKLIRLGKKIEIIERGDQAFIVAAQELTSACFIIISYSGETTQTLRLAKKLNQKKVPLIALTSFGENSLTQFADITLHLSTREKLIGNIGNFSSVLSAIYLFDILYGCIFGENYQDNYKNKTRAASEYEQFRHSNNPMLND